MTKLEKILLSFSITFSIFVVGFMLFKNPQPVYGSVSQGSSYHSTTTRAFNGTALTNLSLLQLGPGDLGSVVITGAGTGVINIYDATTTGPHSDSATTTIASFPASTAAGTYTFDAQYYKGLIIEIIGSAATSTITYR